MVQKRETKAINKLCVREIRSLYFVCGAYFFEFRGRNLVCFVIAYNFNGKYAPEAGKTRMHTAFFTRALLRSWMLRNIHEQKSRMTPSKFFPWLHSSWSLSVENQIAPFATLKSGTEGPITHGSHIVLIFPIRLLGVDDPC